VDLADTVYGRLYVIGLDRQDPATGKSYWRCECACGVEKIVRADALRSGATQSCGCWSSECTIIRATKHGLGVTKEGAVWQAAKQRCYNPNHRGFKNYGGRGIGMSAEWYWSFEQFYKDMGPCPSGLSLERMDNDGDYCKDNCKWATRTEQNRNTRTPLTNTSGYRGASWVPKLGKWKAQINLDGKHVHLGLFDTVEDAAMVYAIARESR
jgi:hypothetical protein